MDFHSFKNANPGIISISREIQELRYTHYEKLRQDTIKAVKEERKKIMESNPSANDSKQNVFLSKIINSKKRA